MEGISRYLREFWKNVAAVLIVMAAGGASAQQVADLRVPSPESTGGGSLAVRAYFPGDPADFRYGESGAPVAVIALGTTGPGNLDMLYSEESREIGAVLLKFLFPGGEYEGRASDGTYDWRGLDSQRALRDVLRFATGEIQDSEGRSLEEIVGGPIREDQVGLLAFSNGVPISMAALGRFGGEIPPLPYILFWEGALNDQFHGFDLPVFFYDPTGDDADSDGVLNNDVLNGAYISYDYPRLNIDYTRIEYDSEAHVVLDAEYNGIFYFDNNGDGVFNQAIADSWNSDTNQNGFVDPTEDYPLLGQLFPVGLGGKKVAILSRGAADAAGSALNRAGVSQWPEPYMQPSAVEAWWDERDPAERIGDALALQPAMRAMVVYSETDHFYINRGKAHIQMDYETFRRSGRWARLNPDAAYLRLFGEPAGPVDVPANIDPLPEQMPGFAEPDDVGLSRVELIFAGTAEMFDRSVSDNWSDDLDQVLHPPGTTAWMLF